MLPRFTYLRAATLEEARQLLNQYTPKARLVAGGTELFPRMKYHLDAPEVLIGVKRVPEASVAPDSFRKSLRFSCMDNHLLSSFRH